MIENAQMTDKGVYECMARNAAGESKARAARLNMEQSDQPGKGKKDRYMYTIVPMLEKCLCNITNPQ